MNKLYIWGTGCSAGELLRESLDIDKVYAFVDSKPMGGLFMGKPVLTPVELSKSDYELIIVASRSCREIRKLCIELGIKLDKLLFLKNNFEISDINESYSLATEVLGKATLNSLLPKPRIISENRSNVSRLTERDTEDDYIRLKTLELAVGRLEAVEGCAAELGVYKGNFARCINLLLPDRKLYLFDTFCGFNEDEIRAEKCTTGFAQAHMNTNAEHVYNRMPHKENVEIRQGLFPESLRGLEERFALVSLDVDLEQSTYAGLEYFVPRMNRGGYIFLHDYGSHLTGVRTALERYERDIGKHIPALPLCDLCGSIVLCM